MSTDAAKAAEGNKNLKEIDVNVSEGQTVTKKKQKKSTSYALKALNAHVETLVEDKLWTKQEGEEIKGKVKEAAEKFIKREYGL